jgi:hypothetical protein
LPEKLDVRRKTLIFSYQIKMAVTLRYHSLLAITCSSDRQLFKGQPWCNSCGFVYLGYQGLKSEEQHSAVLSMTGYVGKVYFIYSKLLVVV